MGEFYDRGPYVMDVIINISILKMEFKERVVIVLGYADFQKYRFKYELDKDLLKLNKIKWPNTDVKIETDFGIKIYGESIPIDVRIEKYSKRNYDKMYQYILFERIKAIMHQTHNGYSEYCLLMNKNVYDLYYMAENEQNVELQLLCQQLGAFFLVYPFIPIEKYRTYICAEEIEHIIFHLLEEIKKIIDYERSYRTDFFHKRYI